MEGSAGVRRGFRVCLLIVEQRSPLIKSFRATAVAGPTPFVLLGDKQGRLSILTCPVEGNRATASLVGTVRHQGASVGHLLIYVL